MQQIDGICDKTLEMLCTYTNLCYKGKESATCFLIYFIIAKSQALTPFKWNVIFFGMDEKLKRDTISHCTSVVSASDIHLQSNLL
jgi:hypothetical protein